MAGILDWKFTNPEGALQQFSNHPLGSASIDHKPVGLALESNLSFGGDDAGKLTLNTRGTLTVAVLNDPTDPDEDGILSSAAAKTPDGALPPQLMFDPERAYLKFRAEAGVKAGGDVPIGALIGIDVSADASAVFADYRVHRRSDLAREAFVLDVKNGARFVTKLADILALNPGEALAFRFAGALNAAVTLSWSDVFTGQIGTLGKLLGTTAPIAISLKAGASVSLGVSVSDDFLTVFSKANGAGWCVGVRKVKSSRVAPSADVGIDVGFANPKELRELVGAALDGVLGAPLAKVKSVLSAASLDSLGTAERKIATALIERFGLKGEFATIEALRKRVDEVEKRIGDIVEKVVKTRVALSFAYEYSRVSLETNLLQARLDEAAVRAFHADVIKAKTQSLTQAIREKRPGIELELYLNQKEITRARSWGFTLGLGKWATIGGKDFKKVATIRRFDINQRVQESYLGVRSYKGQWVGEKSEWGVDIRADMKDYSFEPLVSDYSFGIHLLWVSDQKELSGSELEQWLDSAVIWQVLREQDVMDTRARVASALGKAAMLTVQVTIPNGVVRAVLPTLAASPLDGFAAALAVAMPWMNTSTARSSAGRRRQVYSPLWASYLHDPEQPQSAYAQAAFKHLKTEGHPEMATREVFTLSGPDAFSFAGLTQLNGNTRGACDAFTRGVSILHTAITSGARNQKTIDKAFNEMDDLWSQSHHVRAIGAYLLGAAERVGVAGDVTRTMTIDGKGLLEQIVVTV